MILVQEAGVSLSLLNWRSYGGIIRRGLQEYTDVPVIIDVFNKFNSK